jgi:arsenate reductase
MLQKLRVLILCTGNSARSQMAEGFWRHLGGDRWVNPVAVRVMAEAGVDISAHRSKSVSEFQGRPFDLVVTVCDNAAAACPSFPGAKCQVHWPFEDPPHSPEADAAKLVVWRRVRDQIRTRISEYLQQQQGAGEGE